MDKRYLGDSVYVEVDAGMLKLTTENGYGPSNTIYMEPEVMNSLVEFYREATRPVPPDRKEPEPDEDKPYELSRGD